MKRCYFLGMNEIYDAELIDRLADECERIIESEEEIEFWFLYGEGLSFIGSCLSLVTHLKSKYPEKNIKIIRVLDPVKGRKSFDWYREVYYSNFPVCISDRQVFAALMDEGVARIENQFVQQANKVERWVLRQMNVVFAYYYANLEDSVISQIEYAQKSCDAEVIQIRFEETERFIQEKAETMFDERTTMILSMIRENVPYREIGKAVGVSTSRVGQIAHDAARDIRHELKKRGVRMQRETNDKCGLIGLGNNANAFQLVVFKSLLEYLSEKYQIKEFWVDEKSSNTPYGAILAMFCASREARGRAAKVVVRLNETDTDQWDECIGKYVPPYSSVINLGVESPEQSAFYREVLRQCNCVITDYRSPDSRTIRELCAEGGNYLFDMPKETFEIIDQYKKVK